MPIGRRQAVAALIALCLLTVGFQAIYVFLPERSVRRGDNFDYTAHLRYFDWISQHPVNPLAFRGSYTWNHFPSFYQWNTFVAETVSWLTGEPVAGLGLKVAWFLQAAFRVGTLALLWATFRRLFRSPGIAAAALVLCATSPRVFFATIIWNQDEYVFFFAAICMYVTVAAIQDGLTTRRMIIAALAAAFGFHVKITMLVPIAAMLIALVLLPMHRASLVRKATATGLVGVAMLAVNWRILTTDDGLIRFRWMTWPLYKNYRVNADDLVGAYLTLNAGPILHPDYIYNPVSKTDRTNQNSAATAMYLYLFELYENFQGPNRTWINVLCVWTGTPLLGLVLWRTGRAVLALRHPATMPRDEIYCAALVLLSFAALVAFSLRVPFGWWPHPEYILAAYPAAAVLLFRQLCATRRVEVVRLLSVIAVLHLAANLALLGHNGQYKMAVGLKPRVPLQIAPPLKPPAADSARR